MENRQTCGKIGGGGGGRHSTTGDGLGSNSDWWYDEHGAKPAMDSMSAHISAGNMNERGSERTAAGLGRSEGGGRGEGAGGGGGGRGLSPYFSSCLKRDVGRGGGREGGLSPYFNLCRIRVLAAKHFPCSSPTPIHITPVLLHP